MRRPGASEWLETNGAGGFACGTTLGELRRFWHGLLWVSRRPPVDRVRVVAGVQESAARADRRLRTISSHWDGAAWRNPAVPPRPHVPGDGWSYPEEFPAHPCTYWSPARQVQLRRIVAMPRFEQRTLLRYDLARESRFAVCLRLQFLFPEKAEIRPDLIFSIPPSPVAAPSTRDVTCVTELDCEDHHTDPMLFTQPLDFMIEPGEVLWVDMASAGTRRVATTEDALASEAARRSTLTVPAIESRDPALAHRLAQSADQFIVRRRDGNMTLLAGYPWFTDWGRDTMISLPGLCLRTGRFEEARSMISHFLAHLDRGIIPNLFPEAGETPHYNTVDATLWMFETIARYIHASGDGGFLRKHYQRLREVLHWHVHGTHNNIHVDPDGLLFAGGPGTQLTWMDVKVDDEVPTPRHGRAVEIQGLWYNALLLMADFARTLGQKTDAAEWQRRADLCRQAFEARFAPVRDGSLPDVVDRDGPGTADNRCRPNQVIPFGLTHNIIPEAWRPRLLNNVARCLLTPYGLRTLARSESEYHGVYKGNRLARDRAYHQGTIWPWLLGPFVAGLHRNPGECLTLERQYMRPGAGPCRLMLRHFLEEGCAGSVSEIFDGDQPHHPRGCFAQGWSVAALIEWMCLL